MFLTEFHWSPDLRNAHQEPSATEAVTASSIAYSVYYRRFHSGGSRWGPVDSSSIGRGPRGQRPCSVPRTPHELGQPGLRAICSGQRGPTEERWTSPHLDGSPFEPACLGGGRAQCPGRLSMNPGGYPSDSVAFRLRRDKILCL